MSQNTRRVDPLPSKKDIEEMVKHRRKLQQIWENRPKGLTFPREYLNIQKENEQLENLISSTNKVLEFLMTRRIKNDKTSARILVEFFEGMSEEERAQYIQPNQVYLSYEEKLMATLGKCEQIRTQYIPPTCKYNTNRMPLKDISLTDEEKDMLLGEKHN